MSQEKFILFMCALSASTFIALIALAIYTYSLSQRIKNSESEISKLDRRLIDTRIEDVKWYELKYVLNMGKRHEIESVLAELNAQQFTDPGSTRDQTIEEIMVKLTKVAPPISYKTYRQDDGKCHVYRYRGGCGNITITIQTKPTGQFVMDCEWKV